MTQKTFTVDLTIDIDLMHDVYSTDDYDIDVDLDSLISDNNPFIDFEVLDPKENQFTVVCMDGDSNIYCWHVTAKDSAGAKLEAKAEMDSIAGDVAECYIVGILEGHPKVIEWEN